MYVTTGTEESSLCSTQVLSSSLLYTQQCTHGSLHLPAHLHPHSLVGVLTFILYVYVSDFALQIDSFVPLF